MSFSFRHIRLLRRFLVVVGARPKSESAPCHVVCVRDIIWCHKQRALFLPVQRRLSDFGFFIMFVLALPADGLRHVLIPNSARYACVALAPVLQSQAQRSLKLLASFGSVPFIPVPPPHIGRATVVYIG